MTEKIKYNKEDITETLEKVNFSAEHVASKEDLENEIKNDIQKLEDKIEEITDIPAEQEERIRQLGGDIKKVKEKTKDIFNPLRTIRDKMERNFSKIIGVLGIVAGAAATADYITGKQIEKKELEYKQERKTSKEKWELRRNDEKILDFFKHIKADSTESAEFINDLHVLFSDEEMMYEVPSVINIDDTLQRVSNFEFLLNKENRKRVMDIESQFEASPDYILRFLVLNEDLQQRITSKDFYTDLFPKIVEIRNLIPHSDEKPSINFIDFTNNFEGLKNPEYKKALQFLMSKNFRPKIGEFIGLSDNIIKIYSDKELHNFATELDNRGIWFDQTISWDTDNVSHQKLLSYLDKAENRKIKRLFDKDSPLGQNEIAIMTSDKPYAIKEKALLENPDSREMIESLKESGCSLKMFLSFDEQTCANILHNEQYREAFVFLINELDSNDPSDQLFNDIPKLMGYYKEGDGIDIARMKRDIERIQKVGKMSVNYFYNLITQEKLKAFEPILLTSQQEDVHLDDFSSDPAFHYIIEKMNLLVETPQCLKSFTSVQQKEWIMRISRNMYITNTEPTQENFERIFNETVAMRSNAEILEQSLFKNRNVALFAHNELIPEMNNEDRFGNDLTVSSLKKQKPVSFEMFKAVNNTDQGVLEQKRKFLIFVSTHDKLTILINAHGSSDAIYFTNGIPNKEGKIEKTNDYDFVTVNELSMALEMRFDNGHTDPAMLVFASCYNQNFIRGLYDAISSINETKQKSIPLPVMAGSTEYGQFGFSDYSSKYKDPFIQALLEGKKDTKIMDIIDIEKHAKEKEIMTNPSLFIPLQEIGVSKKIKDPKKETFFQIAETIDKVKNQVSHMESFARSVQDGMINDQTASYFEEVQPKTAKAIREAIKKQNVTEPENQA